MSQRAILEDAMPGKLIQTSPPLRGAKDTAGTFAVIDLDHSKYDRIASRFAVEKQEGVSFLKSGIETRNPAFNQLIERIEQVAIASKAPILLTGPTGTGKSRIARRIYELKKTRRQLTGAFVEVNCATLRGDGAMSALFGHVKGSFTGATSDRPGLMKMAHGGMLFLDEIGELGVDEQAMLLRADPAAEFDRFDRVQLADVLQVCRQSHTISEAGRVLFSASRQKKSNVNDADRLRKNMARFGLNWNHIKEKIPVVSINS